MAVSETEMLRMLFFKSILVFFRTIAQVAIIFKHEVGLSAHFYPSSPSPICIWIPIVCPVDRNNIHHQRSVKLNISISLERRWRGCVSFEQIRRKFRNTILHEDKSILVPVGGVERQGDGNEVF